MAPSVQLWGQTVVGHPTVRHQDIGWEITLPSQTPHDHGSLQDILPVSTLPSSIAHMGSDRFAALNDGWDLTDPDR